MYTRGQFALIGKVGRKALRLYDEEGLLVPVAVNGENGYHYYDRSHCSQRLKRNAWNHRQRRRSRRAFCKGRAQAKLCS